VSRRRRPCRLLPSLVFGFRFFQVANPLRLQPPYIRGSGLLHAATPLYILHVATPLYKGVSPGPGGGAAPPACCLPCVRVSGFGIRILGFGFRDSYAGFLDLGFGFRVPGF